MTQSFRGEGEGKIIFPPGSCWPEILKIIDGQVILLTVDQFLNSSLIQAGGGEAH